MEKQAIVAILAIAILTTVVLPAAFSFDRHDVDVLCDASEDYEENKEQCDELYEEVKEDEDDSESERWNEKDYKESKQDDDDDKDKKYGVKSKQDGNEVTRYYDDKDDAEEAYKNLDRNELTHQDKSFNDWEYDDEEHPSLK